MNTKTKMVRCRIAQLRGDHMQYCIYVGPQDKIPAGWSICMKRVVSCKGTNTNGFARATA